MIETRQRTGTVRRTTSATVSSTVFRFSSLLLLAISLAVFLALTLRQLNLPGLYYDEALDLVPMLQVMHGEPVDLLRGIGVTIGSYTFPVMLLDYMGSLNGYLAIPFMAVLGPGVAAARLQPILFSALTIVLAYALARAWFGRGVAAVTALLLAVNPSFIWFSRQGISVTSVMTVFSLGSLLLIDRWRRQRKQTGDRRLEILSLSFAGVLLGLGLWAKFLFLWWIVVLVVLALVWVILSPGLLTDAQPSFSARLVANIKRALRGLPWVGLGFLIGAAPLIYFNLHDLLGRPFDLRNAYTLGLLFQSISQPTQYGVNNLDLLTNLRIAIADFGVFIDGSYFWYNGVPFSNVYAVPVFLISALLGSILAFRRPEWRLWLALLAAIAVTVLISAFTVSGFWATHLFIVLPLPQLVVATAAVWLSFWIAGKLPLLRRILAPAFVCVLLVLPVSRDLWVSEQHHATLAETGGSGRFSDAVYKLAAYLDAQHMADPIALDWGIEKSVRVLTADRVRPEEVFGYSTEPDDAFVQRVKELLRDPSRRYIVLWDRFAVYNRRKAFTQIANDMGLQVVETFISHERSGLPVYVILQAK